MRLLGLTLGLLLAALPALADMYPDASNAKLPQARVNLGIGTYDPVKDHNAPIDGTSDAAAQINASLTDCGGAGGGRVILPPHQYAVIAADLVVPAGCSLEMASAPQMQQFDGIRYGAGSRGAEGVNIMQPALRLDASKTIQNHGTIRSLAIFKRGLTYPTSMQDTFTQVAAFSGTAITNAADDTTLDDVFIIGFEWCYRSDSFQRPYLRHLRLHCKNGLYFNHAHDVAHVSDVHGWGYFPGNDPNGYGGHDSLVSGASNNGSGLIRLTVNETGFLATGNTVSVRLVGGMAGANGDWVITVIDGTHLDLQGSVYAGVSTTGNSWVNGETFVATTSLAGVWPGQAVTGAGIAPGTTVRTIDPFKPGLWLSKPTTAAGAGVTLSFTNGAYTSGGQVSPDPVLGPMEKFISVTNSEEMHFTDIFQYGWKIGAYVSTKSVWATFTGFGCDGGLQHMPGRTCMYWDDNAVLSNWVGGQGGGNSVLLVDKSVGGTNSISSVNIREPFGAPFVMASLQGSAESQLANLLGSCTSCSGGIPGNIAIYTGAGRKYISGMMPWIDVYPQNFNVAISQTLIMPGTTLASSSPFNNERFSWTPTLLIGGVLSPGATYVAQQAIGDKRWPWVESDFALVLSAKGSGGPAGVAIGGFPYSCGGYPSGSGLAMASVDPATGLTGAPMFEQVNGSPIINLRQTSATGLGFVTDANLTNSSVIRGQFKCVMNWVQR